MYITIEVRVSKDRYSYRDKEGKAEIIFEIDDTGAEHVINTLGPLMQAASHQALQKYLNPQPEEE